MLLVIDILYWKVPIIEGTKSDGELTLLPALLDVCGE